MKIFAVCVLVLAGLLPAYADTTVVNVSATPCHPDFFVNSCLINVGVVPNFDLEATLTLQLTGGRFLDVFQDLVFFGPEEEVLSMTGTFNGSPITLAQAPQDTSSYLFGEGDNDLGAVYFTAAGINGTITAFFDDANRLIAIPNEGTFEIDWSVTSSVDTPEPASLSLALIGLSLLSLRRKAR